MEPPSDDADEEVRCRFVGLKYLEDRVLQPAQTLTIWLSCKPEEIGLHTVVIHFDLGDEKIEKVAFLLAEDKVSQSLFSDKPYSRARNDSIRHNQILSLEVPGLAERRPSLVYGDYIFVQLATHSPDDDNRTYQGIIQRVEADEIFLRFDENLHRRHRNKNLYNVSFKYNRVNMRRLYQAILAAEKLGPQFLFPWQSSHRRMIETSSFMPLNAFLNSEQVRSVEMILGCKGAPPYVIYGPPGTGKMMTLAEAILQLYKTRRKARIPVCAPSNNAADHILEKLLDGESIGIRENDIFRLNATTRRYEDVQPEFIQFCFFEDMVFKHCPPLKALLCYKIIASIYTSASLLYSEGIYKGHFSQHFLG
ncbi:hypothetical protein COCNU_08G001010 [Cocos nucifera]|uniref:RNA helicase SDE3 n=1 Tax=Cocos nucifera TaxID=13894 RepID=A0A8K0IH84_COCNU|nr:hypothetical protein COCNU_08G001010 [Cocos nucifera]